MASPFTPPMLKPQDAANWHALRNHLANLNLNSVEGDLAVSGSITSGGDINSGAAVTIVGTGETIGGTTFDNGWLRLGSAASGLTVDNNEFYFSGIAGNIGSMTDHDVHFNRNATTQFELTSTEVLFSTQINASSHINRNGDLIFYRSGAEKLRTYSGGIDVTGSIRINDSNTAISEGGGNAFRLQTNSGYVDIGPQNTGGAHIYTDRAVFYINKSLVSVGTNDLGSTSYPWRHLRLTGTLYFHGTASNDYLSSVDNTYIRHVVNGTERFRVTTAGPQINGNYYFGIGSNDYVTFNDTNNEFSFYRDGVETMSFGASSNWYSYHNGETTTFTTTLRQDETSKQILRYGSGRKLKTDIVPLGQEKTAQRALPTAATARRDGPNTPKGDPIDAVEGDLTFEFDPALAAQIHPYSWIPSEEDDAPEHLRHQRYIGYVADEVHAVVPSLAGLDVNLEPNNVNYEAVGVLKDAWLQQQIDELREEIRNGP